MEIDVRADFLSFQKQIIEMFGKQYSEQTELFFDRAIVQAEKDYYSVPSMMLNSHWS